MLRSPLLPALLVAAALTGSASAQTAPSAGTSHAAWHDCLRQAYSLRASLSGRDIAADAALRACRDAEAAYLAALSTSPLLDGEDVDRVRPALVTKARAWLTGAGAKPSSQARAL